jgi:hypothetical protein
MFFFVSFVLWCEPDYLRTKITKGTKEEKDEAGFPLSREGSGAAQTSECPDRFRPGHPRDVAVSPLESRLSTPGPAPLQEALRSDCSPRTTAIFNSLRFE